ncbi:hypothetical protein OIU85_026330 [Salix viminalis]|uniref:Uncharacterized protein n=1 Tax=Salix viminalis TaxID=40686 RepID=A0A9Q0TNA5_SALVM|nr:hypothetical protein OIU85_026330 [Salix viminalis]
MKKSTRRITVTSRVIAGDPIDRVVGYDEEFDDIEDQSCSPVGWPELGISPASGFCMDDGNFNQKKMNLKAKEEEAGCLNLGMVMWRHQFLVLGCRVIGFLPLTGIMAIERVLLGVMMPANLPTTRRGLKPRYNISATTFGNLKMHNVSSFGSNNGAELNMVIIDCALFGGNVHILCSHLNPWN